VNKVKDRVCVLDIDRPVNGNRRGLGRLQPELLAKNGNRVCNSVGARSVTEGSKSKFEALVWFNAYHSFHSNLNLNLRGYESAESFHSFV
jgi:hypothetical protein